MYIPKQPQNLVFGKAKAPAIQSIVNRSILTIWTCLRSLNPGALAKPKSQTVRLFGYKLPLILFSLTCFSFLSADFDSSPKSYPFVDDPIDVIIPTASKDEILLEKCVEGIKKNVQNIRRIIVVSDHKITDKAEWYDEKAYPFSKYDVSLYLNQLDKDRALSYLNEASRVGWYFQQLLKLYAAYVIPGISSNILIVDSDVIFFRPVSFLSPEGGGYFSIGSEYHLPYFEHANRLLPGIKRLNPSQSGIAHQMLFQKAVLDDLFQQVESFHKKEFWKAFCLCVDPSELLYSGASEYEIYFNFVFARTKQVKVRNLHVINSGDINAMKIHRNAGYDYAAYHSWMRR